MIRLPSLILVLALLCLPSASFAADPPTPEKPVKLEEQIVKITLHPMAEARPALKYQLLPPFLDRHSGNAAVHWNRLPAEETNFLIELNKPGGSWEKTEKWMSLALGSTQEKDARAKEPAINQLLGSNLYSRMDYAARFESCDWELPVREGHVFEILLPEVQMTRTWGRMLAAKIHAEIADRKYADAIHTMQTDLALARHIAQGPTLIHGLVAIAVASQATGQVEQLIQQPDAPNLYWALTSLPSPLVDFRPACEFEMNGLVLQFTELQGLDKKKMTNDEWTALLGRFYHEFFSFSAMMGNVNAPGAAGPSEAAYLGKILLGYPRAKKFLIDHGRTKAEVDAMPQAQVILLYTLLFYEELRDDIFKSMYLPYPQANVTLKHAEDELVRRRDEELIPAAGMLLPALISVKQSETRMQWFIARLRVLEALRIYAAAHDGKLPEQLSDIREVPVPTNPFDDHPFTYHRDGNRATLGCETGPRNMPWRYEITLAAR